MLLSDGQLSECPGGFPQPYHGLLRGEPQAHENRLYRSLLHPRTGPGITDGRNHASPRRSCATGQGPVSGVQQLFRLAGRQSGRRCRPHEPGRPGCRSVSLQSDQPGARKRDHSGRGRSWCGNYLLQSIGGRVADRKIQRDDRTGQRYPPFISNSSGRPPLLAPPRLQNCGDFGRSVQKIGNSHGQARHRLAAKAQVRYFCHRWCQKQRTTRRKHCNGRLGHAR